MRFTLINFLKKHRFILDIFWKLAGVVMWILGLFVATDKKMVIFASFGGRKFDDSPRAIYEEMCERDEFKDWKFVWAFVNPDLYSIPRGKKVKIDTFSFFYYLIKSKVWVSNSGMTRGIKIKKRGVVRVETWHGTPLKKICGDEHTGGLYKYKKEAKQDDKTIRCAQSEYDKKLFVRLFNATPDCIYECDLPRNDKLLKYSQEEMNEIKENLNIEKEKKIILYAPTYREYLKDGNGLNINLDKWNERFGDNYILLIRVHYAVAQTITIKSGMNIIDVSNYPTLNDLYAISDMMISDYSSTFFDYSILGRPMFCYAYDLDEYEEKRGLYLELDKVLPCRVDSTEDMLYESIATCDYAEACKKTKGFAQKYVPNAGKASEFIVDKIIQRC